MLLSFVRGTIQSSKQWLFLRRFFAWLVVSVGLTFLVVGAYRGISTSSHFALKKIVFSGGYEEIQKEIQKEVESDLGKNIFSVSLDEIERSIARRTKVRHVRVRRHFPDALEISIELYTPKLLVEMGGLYLADQHGTVYERALGAELSGLVRVTGIDRDVYGAYRGEMTRLLHGVVVAMNTYGTIQGGVGTQITGVRLAFHAKRATQLDEIVFMMDGATELHVSGESLWSTRELWEKWKAVWGQIRERGKVPVVVFMNQNTYPDRVVVRYESL